MNRKPDFDPLVYCHRLGDTRPDDAGLQAAGGTVLVLFDEVLNYLNRHRAMADSFHAFIQNLTVATTGTTRAAAVISLPRSQVEMTESDQQWQDRITKVVRQHLDSEFGSSASVRPANKRS